MCSATFSVLNDFANADIPGEIDVRAEVVNLEYEKQGRVARKVSV